jgi:RNA polymerase sigma-70 factor (ECF subfamily)
MVTEVGDDEATFARLYPRLRRLAAVAAPAEVEPDDLVQDALVRVLRRGPLSDLDDPGAFLAKVIVNLASNSRRGLGRRRTAWARHGAAAEDELPDYPSDLADLEALAPQERALLFLVDVEGWSFDHAAAVLGLSPAAARQRASRARKQLRLDLGGTP